MIKSAGTQYQTTPVSLGFCVRASLFRQGEAGNKQEGWHAMTERWKAVSGFEGHYEVSSSGRIRSVPHAVSSYGGRSWISRGRVLKQNKSTRGYMQVHLSKGPIRSVKPVHVIVTEAFIGIRKHKMTVNHIDGNKENNSSDNLEICSIGENNRHALRTGLRINPRGSKNGQAKLSEGQVAEIKRRLAGGESQTAISRDYCVTNKLIHAIAKQHVWRHV